MAVNTSCFDIINGKVARLSRLISATGAPDYGNAVGSVLMGCNMTVELDPQIASGTTKEKQGSCVDKVLNSLVGPNQRNGLKAKVTFGELSNPILDVIGQAAVSTAGAAFYPSTNCSPVVQQESILEVWFDLVHCNLPLQNPTSTRTDTVVVTSTNPVVTDTTITLGDLGKTVTGTGIPAGSYVGTVISGTSFRLSSTPWPLQTDVPATGAGTSAVIANPAQPIYGRLILPWCYGWQPSTGIKVGQDFSTYEYDVNVKPNPNIGTGPFRDLLLTGVAAGWDQFIYFDTNLPTPSTCAYVPLPA